MSNVQIYSRYPQFKLPSSDFGYHKFFRPYKILALLDIKDFIPDTIAIILYSHTNKKSVEFFINPRFLIQGSGCTIKAVFFRFTLCVVLPVAYSFFQPRFSQTVDVALHVDGPLEWNLFSDIICGHPRHQKKQFFKLVCRLLRPTQLTATRCN